MTATQTRATSTYVGAYTAAADLTLSETLDELLTAAHDEGLIVQGSHLRGGTASLVLRFRDDEEAVAEFHHLSADVLAPLRGVVTGLGVHRRQVTA